MLMKLISRVNPLTKKDVTLKTNSVLNFMMEVYFNLDMYFSV